MLDAQPLTIEDPAVQAVKAEWNATTMSKTWAARGYTFEELFECFKADCVRHSTLAKEVGVSRERVRQIYDTYFGGLFGKTGVGRLQACTRENRLVAYKRLENILFDAEPFKNLFDKALAAGCALEGVPVLTSMPMLMASRVRINSHLCSLHLVEKGYSSREHADVVYARATVPSFIAGIYAMIVQTRIAGFPERVFVLPVQIFGPSLPKTGRNLYLPTEKHPVYKNIVPKIDWWAHENAWHLLPPPSTQSAP